MDAINSGNGSDVVVVSAVVGTSSDSSRVTVAGNNNDTGQDTITGFSLTSDTLKVVATNVSSFVHGTDTGIGTAGTGGNSNTGNLASFTTGTGLVELNQTTNDDWDDLGDIAVTFNTPSGTFNEANFEARLRYDLTGTGGADTITTGDGNDRIQGGGGADVLNGGIGSDVFAYAALADSTVASFDSISGFVHGTDQIDFTTIGGIDSFQGQIVGGNVAANSIGWVESGGNTLIYVNATSASEAVGSAQMQITLTGVGLGLTATDFNFI